jgi:hypothetical protein
VSYNASVVKMYCATSSLVRFEYKNIFLHLKNSLASCNAGVVFVNLEVVGLASGRATKNSDMIFRERKAKNNKNFLFSSVLRTISTKQITTGELLID